jgi:hypothetical protein
MDTDRALSAARVVHAVLALLLLLAALLPSPAAAGSSQTDILGPAGSAAFGRYVAVLPNGNFVVTDPDFSSGGQAKRGAVHLYDGSTLALISTMTGSYAGDELGSHGIVILSSGDYLVISPMWGNGAALDAGAVTWCSQITGCPAAVSPANSLVGSSTNDRVGLLYPFALENGGYVIRSHEWDNGMTSDAGALKVCTNPTGCSGAISPLNSLAGGSTGDQVGWGSISYTQDGSLLVFSSKWDHGSQVDAGAWALCRTTGVSCTGYISYENSLVGEKSGDLVNSYARALPNGNYVLRAPYWDKGSVVDVGAVIWCSGVTGCTGTITQTNSLIGSKAEDRISSHGIINDAAGNYVVFSAYWSSGSNTNAGAVTWCKFDAPCSGTVGAVNSLVGTLLDDRVGERWDYSFHDTTSFYLVVSPRWANGEKSQAGAVTWCSFTGGCKGEVSAANSLVGDSAFDGMGLDVRVGVSSTFYVTAWPGWDNGAVKDAGLVRVCSAASGCAGIISPLLSLHGTQANDRVGQFVAIPGGSQYVVASYYWNNGAVAGAGAVSVCSAEVPCVGAVSAANSLVGSTKDDNVGMGSYTWTEPDMLLFSSPNWDNGTAVDAGAVTYCGASNPCTGPLSAANSLVGSHSSDRVGSWGFSPVGSGSYVVASPTWDNGELIDAGAVTWCSAAGGGCRGKITAANSLLGLRSYDEVGFDGFFTLENGNYVVRSPYWGDTAGPHLGAVTWCRAEAGCHGEISSANSLTGSTEYDNLGHDDYDAFADGSYLIRSTTWDSGSIQDAGLIAWCSGETGCRGAAASYPHAVRGGAADGGKEMSYAYDAAGYKLVVGRPLENIVTVVRLPQETSFAVYMPLLVRR